MKTIISIVLLILLILPAESQEFRINVGGRSRQYFLHRSFSLPADAPLVFVLHGYSGSAASMKNWSGMNKIAEDNGFAVCYPQGINDDWNNSFWNVGYEFHNNETVDDVEFITTLAQYLQNTYNLSTENTFCTGMSNGGDMSYLLACQASDVFKAVAPVAGCMMEWITTS